MTKIKKDQKGFSLVELIIVIAIMAVLIGLLAPQYLKYVEKSRISRAVSNTKAITDAIQITLTDDYVWQSDRYANLANDLISGGNTSLSNPFVVNLADDDDEFVARLHDTIDKDHSDLQGSISFYLDQNYIAFSFSQSGSIYSVYYGAIDASDADGDGSILPSFISVDPSKIVKQDGNYIVYRN